MRHAAAPGGGNSSCALEGTASAGARSEFVRDQGSKEQILRVPTPETERKFKEYTRRSRRRGRSCCRRCLCWSPASSSSCLSPSPQPPLPKYSVEGLSIKGFTLKPEENASPEFVVTVRAENPNKKISIDYRGGSSVEVSYSGAGLAAGSWPTFFQGPRRVDVFQSALKGSDVPLLIRTKVPVRIKFGVFTTWTITAKVRCTVVVDGLTENSKIVSSSCRGRVKIW
ncbi:unnamed protein product [Spirodela intermedia]|uniref:Late embryogenesis abundant protein LEA-2 subgroup domain-containing protein n=1 Tax=Spirodela intermedia TaxID=51605 RepID=A0A7I8I9S4_SPIIN|nr:unnamed protein product [Spirodela intermedia]CAA6654466.1 unnamed protein product [Spirodela intermedia]